MADLLVWDRSHANGGTPGGRAFLLLTSPELGPGCMQATLGVFPAAPAGEEAPGSGNTWGLTTDRVQRRRDAGWITPKVPRTFSKEPHSRRSSETTEAEPSICFAEIQTQLISIH